MPFKSGRKYRGKKVPRTYKKRRYTQAKKRYYKRNPRTVTVGKTLPEKIRVKLSDSYTTSVSTTLADTYFEFALNGLYDPYLGTGGGQPQGFDQYATLYTHYRVNASSISVYYFNQENSAITQISIIPHWKQDTSIRTYTNPEQLKYCRYRRYANESGGGGRAVGTLKHYMSVKRLVGDARSIQDPLFAPEVSANPDVNKDGICLWYVLLQDPVSGGTSLQGELMVKITYYVEFFGMRILADS